jgi:hypothetical protein
MELPLLLLPLLLAITFISARIIQQIKMLMKKTTLAKNIDLISHISRTMIVIFDMQ